MSSTASNLIVAVVSGVAVMFIWQQIQKAQAKKIPVNSGGVSGGQTWFGDLYQQPANSTWGVYDIMDNRNKVYSI